MVWSLIVLLGVVLDQAVKLLVRSTMTLNETIPVIDGFFDIYYITNTGGAWSILSNYTWVLTMVSCLMVVFMVSYMFSTRDKFVKLGLSLVIGGAVGNLIDRIVFGKVVDYLAFDIFGYDFPTFNVADMMVVVGTISLAVYIVFFYDKAEARRLEQEAAEIAALKERME